MAAPRGPSGLIPSGASLAGRRVVVTGAARGLGAAAARALAAAGAECVLLDVIADELEAVAEQAEALSGRTVRRLAVDLADRVGCRRAAAFSVEASRGDLGALVHCAGVLRLAPVEKTSERDWDRTLAVNLTSAFLLAQALLPALRAGEGGSVVLTSSRAGVRGFEREAAYCASKFGVEGFAQALAAECAGSGVSANTITPGARIKPTGMSPREEARLDPGQRSWGGADRLGPAFAALAGLSGAPTGRRFRADRITERLRGRASLSLEEWEELAE